MNVLHVIAYCKGIEIGRCNYTFLTPLSYTSVREFTFKDFRVSTPCSVDNSGHSYINVSIYTVNVYGVTVQLNKFKIVPAEEADFTVNGDITVYGTVAPDWYTDVYDQAIIDAFYEWENCVVTNNNYPSNLIKDARIRVKGIYSGLPKSLNRGDVIVDGSTINDKYDFYNELAKKLIGEKGFIGSCYNSLHDSLIESYDREEKLTTNLIIKNSTNIFKAFGKENFQDIIDLLKQYISVEVD